MTVILEKKYYMSLVMSRKEHVLEAWDNAVENGYEQWLLEAEAVDVAIDMMVCDGDIEELFELDFDGLIAIVREVQKEKQKLVDIFPGMDYT